VPGQLELVARPFHDQHAATAAELRAVRRWLPPTVIGDGNGDLVAAAAGMEIEHAAGSVVGMVDDVGHRLVGGEPEVVDLLGIAAAVRRVDRRHHLFALDCWSCVIRPIPHSRHNRATGVVTPPGSPCPGSSLLR
jgi:hypothetical protein